MWSNGGNVVKWRHLDQVGWWLQVSQIGFVKRLNYNKTVIYCIIQLFWDHILISVIFFKIAAIIPVSSQRLERGLCPLHTRSPRAPQRGADIDYTKFISFSFSYIISFFIFRFPWSIFHRIEGSLHLHHVFYSKFSKI